MFAVNDLKNAVPCAASYMLFDPSDEVMKNNVAYYQFHKNQWGLTEEDFLPRSVSDINDHQGVHVENVGIKPLVLLVQWLLQPRCKNKMSINHCKQVICMNF